MTVMQFWQEIGVQAAVSARAEEVLRKNEALFAGLPLHEWRTAPYEEGLSVLKDALGEDADGMKLFVAQSLEALLALREYGERGIGRGIFTATMAFMARFSVVFWEEDSPAFRDWIFPTAVTASGKGADSAAGPQSCGPAALFYSAAARSARGRLSIFMQGRKRWSEGAHRGRQRGGRSLRRQGRTAACGGRLRALSGRCGARSPAWAGRFGAAARCGRSALPRREGQ